MKYDVVGIGRSFMDVIDDVPESFLKEYDLIKGQGNICDVDVLRRIRDYLPEPRLFAGGAAANTAAGLASLGARTAFIGKSCSDRMGGHFDRAFKRIGVKYATSPMEASPSNNIATGRCIVLVTPDTDRTFAMTLGVCEMLTEADIPTDVIKDCKILFVEGQMLVSDTARKAVVHALKIAHEAGVKVAFNMHDLNFSNPAVQDVLGLIRERSEILIGNETEIRGCFGLNPDEPVAGILSDKKQFLAMTRGSRGAQIFADGRVATIPSANKDAIIDSTGAGDQFAAGFLYGCARNLPLDVAGRIGALSAAEVLHHWGGRPVVSLAENVLPQIG